MEHATIMKIGMYILTSNNSLGLKKNSRNRKWTEKRVVKEVILLQGSFRNNYWGSWTEHYHHLSFTQSQSKMNLNLVDKTQFEKHNKEIFILQSLIRNLAWCYRYFCEQKQKSHSFEFINHGIVMSLSQETCSYPEFFCHLNQKNT